MERGWLCIYIETLYLSSVNYVYQIGIYRIGIFFINSCSSYVTWENSINLSTKARYYVLILGIFIFHFHVYFSVALRYLRRLNCVTLKQKHLGTKKSNFRILWRHMRQSGRQCHHHNYLYHQHHQHYLCISGANLISFIDHPSSFPNLSGGGGIRGRSSLYLIL